jgi:hypothetical protein
MSKLERITLLLWVGLVVGAVGCGPDRTHVSGNGNSETHFLETCSGSCPGGLSCVCGVCTKECSTAVDCRGLASNAECASACSAATEAMVCEVNCKADVDCDDLGTDYSCQVGHCRPKTTSGEAGASGTGGKSGTGGTSGASAKGGSGGASARGGTTNAGGAAGDAGGVSSGNGGAGGEETPAAGGASSGSGGASSGSGGAGPTVVTDVASFKLASFEAECQMGFECEDDSDDGISFRAMIVTQQRCVALLAGSPLYLAAEHDLDQKVRAGSIELVLDQVPACLDALRACPIAGSFSANPPACRAVFRGSSPVNGPCSRSEDCADDARCVIDAECPGHCAPRAAPGETCSAATDCDDRAGPVTCSADSICASVTVRDPSNLDGACTPLAWDLTDITPCAPGLYCQRTDSTGVTGICRVPVALDGDCTDVQLCSDGQACLFSAESSAGTCRTMTFADNAGAACDDLGTFCNDTARLVCIDGTCQQLGDGTEGAMCLPLDYAALVQCDPGLVCLDPDRATEMPGPGGYYWGTCGKPRGAGERCSENDDCASQHCRADDTCGDAYCCGEYSCQSN